MLNAVMVSLPAQFTYPTVNVAEVVNKTPYSFLWQDRFNAGSNVVVSAGTIAKVNSPVIVTNDLSVGYGKRSSFSDNDRAVCQFQLLEVGKENEEAKVSLNLTLTPTALTNDGKNWVLGPVMMSLYYSFLHDDKNTVSDSLSTMDLILGKEKALNCRLTLTYETPYWDKNGNPRFSVAIELLK